MELSVLIAQILGLVYVLFGLGLLINGSYYKKAFDDLLKSPGFMIFGGVFALVIGFLLVTNHNFWVKDWTVLVTIIGWAALLKGIMIFLAPEFLIKMAKSILKNTNLIGFGVLIMGLVFGYFGFLA
jgi:uncharacterized protein YjeT (DUF2065 family)